MFPWQLLPARQRLGPLLLLLLHFRWSRGYPSKQKAQFYFLALSQILCVWPVPWTLAISVGMQAICGWDHQRPSVPCTDVGAVLKLFLLICFDWKENRNESVVRCLPRNISWSWFCPRSGCTVSVPLKTVPLPWLSQKNACGCTGVSPALCTLQDTSSGWKGWFELNRWLNMQLISELLWNLF